MELEALRKDMVAAMKEKRGNLIPGIRSEKGGDRRGMP